MEIMFLGGSNTFLRNGYVASVVSALSDHFGISDIKVKNYSVGISACLMGIEQFLLMATNDNPDMIFLEYSINDTSITASKDYLFWRKCYEGLIRMLLLRWPTVQVYGLVFASQNADHRRRIDVMRATISEFGRAYDRFCMVDVDTALRQRYGDVGVYRDTMHYSATVFSDIAQSVIDAVATHPAPVGKAKLPEPVTPCSFDDAKVVSLCDLPNQTIQQFRNSNFDFMSLILQPDESVTLNIPGEIAAITFVSAPQSGILEIKDDSGTNFISTLHAGVATGQFAALLMNAPRIWHDWQSPVPDRQEITLTCRKKSGDPFRPFFSMIEPTSDNVMVQLRSVLVANSRRAFSDSSAV